MSPILACPKTSINGSVLKIGTSYRQRDSSLTDKVAGTFYVQFPVGDLCVYDFPKGRILAQFTFVDDVTIDFQEIP